MDSETAKYASVAVELFKPLILEISKKILPGIGKFLKKKYHENIAHYNDLVIENFSRYFERSYIKNKNVNVLIFPNKQIEIEQIYYPLTLKENSDNLVHITINDVPYGVFEKKKNRILISDKAGMGKSTIMKWIFKKLIEDGKEIPILIELRNISESHTIIDEIKIQLDEINNQIDPDLIFEILSVGGFFLLFDGFDEIQLANNDKIIKDLRQFIDKVPKNKFILTSRPQDELSAFGDFQDFKIKNLTKEETFEIIRKYDNLCDVSNRIGENLIKVISDVDNVVTPLMGNPFLVSLLYSTYAYNKDIPAKKSTFYEEFYSALYKRHDLSKNGWSREKKSGLEFQDFRQVLSALAFVTSKKGKVSYSDHELIDFITEAKGMCSSLKFDSDKFREDLLVSVPIFQKIGSVSQWGHKSIQDFFCAEHIMMNSNKNEILQKIYEKKRTKYYNTLEFILEKDSSTFRATIFELYLKDYIEHYEKSFLDFESYDSELVSIRKCLSFDQKLIVGSSGNKLFDYVSSYEFRRIEENSNLLISNIIKNCIVLIDVFLHQIKQLIRNNGCSFMYELELNKETMSRKDIDQLKVRISKNPRIITDEIDDPYNTPENFNIFTNFLIISNDFTRSSSANRPKILFIDYTLAKKEYEILLAEKVINKDLYDL